MKNVRGVLAAIILVVGLLIFPISGSRASAAGPKNEINARLIAHADA